LGVSNRFSKLKTLLGLTAISAVFLVGCSPDSKSGSEKTDKVSQTEQAAVVSGTAMTDAKSGEVKTGDGKPADTDEEISALGAKVLDHSKFVGKVKMGYMAAQRAPEVCTKLFCYCGCDYTDEHGSLLDCFTSDHGVDCIYCQGEAVLAYKMTRKGASIAEIQKAVDLNWGPHYPFYEQPSETIKKYWKTRLWEPGDGPTAAEKHDEGKPITDPFTGSQDKDGKPMGKPSGECCGGKKDAKAAQKDAKAAQKDAREAAQKNAPTEK